MYIWTRITNLVYFGPFLIPTVIPFGGLWFKLLSRGEEEEEVKKFDGSVNFIEICIVSGLTGVLVLWLGDLESCDCGLNVKVHQSQTPIVSEPQS